MPPVYKSRCLVLPLKLAVLPVQWQQYSDAPVRIQGFNSPSVFPLSVRWNAATTQHTSHNGPARRRSMMEPCRFIPVLRETSQLQEALLLTTGACVSQCATQTSGSTQQMHKLGESSQWWLFLGIAW